MGEPLTKKIRVWNPALDETMSKETSSSSPSISPTLPLNFSKPNVFPSQIPVIMQNYMHLAPLMMRMQQQQMESAMRQRFLSSLAQVRLPQSIPPQAPVENPVVPAPLPASSTPMNPLVASALGVQPVSENCCAMCGASFRLTGDLVTHMRNNHRRTRFKRKNEKPVD